MAYQLRHEGSPQAVADLTLAQVAEGLRDGVWQTVDEIRGPDDADWQAIENHPALADLAEELDAPPRVVHQDATSLDMNALIDVCLVLLIFFIITTSHASIVQKVVPVPTAKTEGKGGAVRVLRPEDVKSKMVRMDAFLEKGQTVIRVENRTVDVSGDDGSLDAGKIGEALKPFVRGLDRKSELLLDAREITWENVIRIQDAARSAGITSIHYLMKKN